MATMGGKRHLVDEGAALRGPGQGPGVVRTLCGRELINVGTGDDCLRCVAIESKRLRTAELTKREEEVPVPSRPTFTVQGRRGGDWFDVPREAYLRLDLATGRADILGDLVEDSEYRVLNTATGEIAYQRLKSAIASPVGWPGAAMVSGRADYAREPKRYRRCKGTRRDRRQCRGGWGK